MNIFNIIVTRHKICSPIIYWNQCLRCLTSHEIATALRPFYFAVHPDLFGQHPNEREVNENSLKLLKSYLETIQHNRIIKPTQVTFYLRKTNSSNQHLLLQGTPNSGTFRMVKILLFHRQLKFTIRQILETCDLSTDYINNLQESEKPKEKQKPKPQVWYRPRYAATADEDPEEELQMYKAKPAETLGMWLSRNSSSAKQRIKQMEPVQEEIERLREELVRRLHLADILWDCGWSVTHFRGCLQSFSALSQQHAEHMDNLEGRVLVFEHTTGVSMEGHVLLSSEDVRNHWLDLIKRVKRYDEVLSRIPAVQNTVSTVLCDIQVKHRKFQPVILAQSYEANLRKLSAALADYHVKNGYPPNLPSSLRDHELVVECDEGPLMLSPTGQFIVPASCPAFLIMKFLSENLNEATLRLNNYRRNKHLEEELHHKCLIQFRMIELKKDDSISPDMMIRFCQRLLSQKQLFINNYLHGTKVFVTHYYSVLQGGEMCIPWNWSDTAV